MLNCLLIFNKIFANFASIVLIFFFAKFDQNFSGFFHNAARFRSVPKRSEAFTPHQGIGTSSGGGCMRPDAPFRLLSRSANKIRFCNCVLNSPDEHLIKRTQTLETSETLDSTIRILIGALRFERRKTSTRKYSQKRILEKIGAPMTNTTTEKLGAKRSLTFQRLHLSISQKERAEKPPK